MLIGLGKNGVVIAGVVALALMTTSCAQPPPAEAPRQQAAQDPVQRGEYLVHTSACEHCHTPGGMYGLPDPERKLAGSELGWKGAWGVRYPRNLTPDMATGLGTWSEDQIVGAIRLAMRPDRTPIRGSMPWFHFVYFTEEDARAIAKYLASIPAVSHKVPDPIAPGEKATGVYIEIPPPPPWDAPRSP